MRCYGQRGGSEGSAARGLLQALLARRIYGKFCSNSGG